MALKVIGAGFGRTGTNSLKVALEQLGLKPCHHMKEVGPSLNQIRWFDAASKGEPVDWDAVFENFEAAVDWPAAAYYLELAEHFPQAKVILSVRDPESWYKSTRETIYAVGKAMPYWLKWLIPPVKRLTQMVQRTVWQGVFAGDFENRDSAIQCFNSHIRRVKESIPADRLLVHAAKEGWEPLCNFLGKPVPKTPYPRVNEARDLKLVVLILKLLAWLPVLLAAALAYYLFL